MTSEQLTRCNGEVASIGVSRLDDPPFTALEYHEACKTCSRWAGKGARWAADMQDFEGYEFLGAETTCKNWLTL